MDTGKKPFRLVLIADRKMHHKDIRLTDADLEFVDESYFNALNEGLMANDFEVIHYENPSQLIDNIQDHKNDVVLSIWSGQKSKWRKASVPSICEAYGIKYIGADPYTHFICQDKWLTRSFCTRHGLKTPFGVLIESRQDIDMINLTTPPVVVKPNYEGGSSGISSKNLVHSHEEAKNLAETLLEIYGSVLVEQFIPGQEISIVLFGLKGSISLMDAVQLVVGGDEYFENSIYGFEAKKEKNVQSSHKPAKGLIQGDAFDSCKRIFDSLDKVEYIRVDGRIYKDQFYCIELTPDSYIGKNCFLSKAFEYNGYNYSDMLCQIINNTVSYYKYQNANKQ